MHINTVIRCIRGLRLTRRERARFLRRFIVIREEVSLCCRLYARPDARIRIYIDFISFRILWDCDIYFWTCPRLVRPFFFF